MSHSPIQIRVLLHHYYSPEPWGVENEQSPAADTSIGYWVKALCLQPFDNDGTVCLRITPRGEAMVALWLRQPVPTVAFLDSDGKPIEARP